MKLRDLRETDEAALKWFEQYALIMTVTNKKLTAAKFLGEAEAGKDLSKYELYLTTEDGVLIDMPVKLGEVRHVSLERGTVDVRNFPKCKSVNFTYVSCDSAEMVEYLERSVAEYVYLHLTPMSMDDVMRLLAGNANVSYQSMIGDTQDHLTITYANGELALEVVKNDNGTDHAFDTLFDLQEYLISNDELLKAFV